MTESAKDDTYDSGGQHVFPVRVYFEDTDAGGVVYYANYLKFAERARTEFLRSLGVESSRLMDEEGVSLVVRHCTLDYKRPARLDDQLEVRSRLLELGGAFFRAEQRIERDDGELVRLNLKLACVNRAGRATRLPEKLRAPLNEFFNTKRRD